MLVNNLKNKYWALLNKLENVRNPRETVLTPHDWKDAIKRIMPNSDKIVIVDGGAHDGVFTRDFSKHFNNIEVHAFEPNTELTSELRNNLAALLHKINHVALGADSGHTTFHIGTSPMTSSVLPSNTNGQNFYHDVIHTRETRSLPMVSLDDYALKNNLKHIHILKLDLQGYELQALKGARELLENRQISAIYTEVNFMPFYEGSALFSDIDQFLKQYDYRLHNLYNLATRNCNNQLTGGDALFIPGATQQSCTIAA
ncbi:FkbM family methyltransferase [Planctomycetota bacterium]|nr:FkbM family methyltransferase [Planctomycetota bacterium]